MQRTILPVRSFWIVVAMSASLASHAAWGQLALAPAVECHPRGGLPNVLSKLDAGEAVRIAYLGGSITAQPGWRPKTLAWFGAEFPQARVSEINAAIGGTGSALGVFRLKHDVLDHEPDLLFVEFAVNDGGAPPDQIYRCMEGIVRQTWKHDPTTDICFVYTLTGNMLQTLQEGHYPRAATAMERIAEHYAVPSIHMGIEVARLKKEGRLIFKGRKPKTDEEKAALGDKILFSPDAVHPYTDSGHQLYLEAIRRSMAQIRAQGKVGPHRLGPPFVADNWEAARMIPLSRAKLSAGWEKLDPSVDGIAKRFSGRLPELWKANRPGETVTFRVRGSVVRIYDLLGPDCGQITIQVDGRPAYVKPRFDAYCTYHRLAYLVVGKALSDDVHEITLTIHPDQPDKVAILSRRSERMDDPARFDDTAWYAGAVLLVGEWLD